MAKRVVTLYVDDTSLRLLVVSGKKVEKWAYLPLEPDLVTDGAILSEAEVAAKIEVLLKAQGVSTRKVIAGLSGLHCLVRLVTLPKLPKALLAEAIQREAERIMPLPPEQLYTSWQIIPTPGEEMQVFLAASPRNAVDALITTLHRAGLDPYLIDIKPLALARVADKPTAIILDVQPTEFDIVIMVDGVPQPVRSLAFPSKALTLSEKIPTLIEDLERTIKFYDSSHPEGHLDPSIPIFVSGELAQEPEAYQSLASELKKHPVSPLSPPLEFPEDLAPDPYMVINIGLALKELSVPKAEANFSVVNLNALPEAYKPKPVPLTNIFTLLGIIILAIALLYPLATRIRKATAETALLSDELAGISQLIEQRQKQKQEITKLETKVSEVEASAKPFTAASYYIEDEQYVVKGDLEVTTSLLPQTIDLSNVRHASHKLTISGTAPSETEILSYAKELRGSGRFSQVSISAMEKTEDGMKFTLTLWSER